jgi:hypothetical protein
MLMSDCNARMTPLKGHPGQHAYTVLFRILSRSLTSVSIFSLSADTLVYLSQW